MVPYGRSVSQRFTARHRSSTLDYYYRDYCSESIKQVLQLSHEPTV